MVKPKKNEKLADSLKEIGADNLQRMMEDAEAKADQRQNMQVGGEAEEEEKDMYGRLIMSLTAIL